MSSSYARKHLDDNLLDVDKLLEIHQKEGGTKRGRRFDLEVLNKSAIVLITSFWEAYCEDIAEEGLKLIVEKANNSGALPKEIKKAITKKIEANKDELAIWEIADDKWRSLLLDNLNSLKEARNRKLNTPKYKNIDELFVSSIGLADVSKKWNFDRKTAEQIREKLDKYIELRGEIAHRGNAVSSVTKDQVVDFLDLVKKIAGKTGGAVRIHVKKITGEDLF